MPKKYKDNNPKLLPTAESQNKVSFSCCSYSVKKKYIEGFCLLFEIANLKYLLAKIVYDTGYLLYKR